MAITPGATGYQLPDGTWVAPTGAFGYGENPYDPETQPALHAQWEFDHQGDAQQIGQNYSPGRVGAIIGGTVAGGALGDYFAAGAGGAGAGGAGASGGGSALSGGAGAGAAETSPYVLGAGAAPATTAAAATPSLGVAGTVGLPAGVGTVAHLATPPPAQPPPPKGSSLTNKIFSLLGLGADYLASRQSQNATAAATQQLQQGVTQAKADLAKVYGGTTDTLSHIVQQQQQNLTPYTSLGAGAASLLAHGLGIPGVSGAPTGSYVPPTDPFGTNGGVTASPIPTSPLGLTPTNPGQGPTITLPGTPFPQPGAQAATPSLPSAPTPPGAALSQTQALPMSSLSPQTQTQSSYVTMRAPTGETQQVPAAQVAWYTQRGAQVVQ